MNKKNLLLLPLTVAVLSGCGGGGSSSSSGSSGETNNNTPTDNNVTPSNNVSLDNGTYKLRFTDSSGEQQEYYLTLNDYKVIGTTADAYLNNYVTGNITPDKNTLKINIQTKDDFQQLVYTQTSETVFTDNNDPTFYNSLSYYANNTIYDYSISDLAQSWTFNAKEDLGNYTSSFTISDPSNFEFVEPISGCTMTAKAEYQPNNIYTINGIASGCIDGTHEGNFTATGFAYDKNTELANFFAFLIEFNSDTSTPTYQAISFDNR